MIILAQKQTWLPKNGERSRRIDEYRAAELGDGHYAMGTLIVCWSRPGREWGWCSARSFRAWIKRTNAELMP